VPDSQPSESDSGLFPWQKLTLSEELWTSAALPVDGLVVPLRGFRKSHQLIPATPDQPGRHRGMAVGGDASAIARTGPRVRINRSRK